MRNENFIRNPYSFGFKDILFPEESKLHVENKEKLIDSDEVDKIMDKINNLTPKEVNKIIDDNSITSMGQLFSYILEYASVDKLFLTIDIGVVGGQIEYRSKYGFRSLITDREEELTLSTSLKICIHAKGEITLKNEERFLETNLHLGIFEGVYSKVELSEIRRNETGLSSDFKSLIEELLVLYLTSPICSIEGFRDTYLQGSKKFLSSILHQVGTDSNASYFNPKTGKEIFLSDLCNYDSRSRVGTFFRQIKDTQDFAFAIEKMVKSNAFFSSELVLETFLSSRISKTNLLQMTFPKTLNLSEDAGFYPSFEIKNVYPSVFLSILTSCLYKSFVFNESDKEERQEQREFLYLKSREALDGYVLPQWMDFEKSLSEVMNNLF